MKNPRHPLGKTSLAIGLASCTLLATTSVNADTILGIYAGAGSWTTSLSGSMGTDLTPITTDELGLNSDNSTFFYVALEHPIPIIPNIKLHHSTLKSEGAATITRDFTWGTQTFPTDADTVTSIDLTQTDVTLYYEILDNWVSMDIGVTAKVLDGTASVTSTLVDSTPQVESININTPIPMFYAMTRFDLPFSGLYVGGQVNYIGYDQSTISDLDVKVGWMFESVLDVGAELGYRQLKMELVDFDGADADLTFDGPYFNLAVHF